MNEKVASARALVRLAMIGEKGSMVLSISGLIVAQASGCGLNAASEQ
jgi:hypothetical protein